MDHVWKEEEMKSQYIVQEEIRDRPFLLVPKIDVPLEITPRSTTCRDAGLTEMTIIAVLRVDTTTPEERDILPTLQAIFRLMFVRQNQGHTRLDDERTL